MVTVDLPAEPLTRRLLYLQTGLVKLLKSLAIDVFYAPGENSYLRIPIPFVMLSRNPSIYAPPAAFENQRMALIKHRLLRQIPVFLSMRRADRVLFVSNTFAREVTRKMRLDVTKTRVVYHGLSPIFIRPAANVPSFPTEANYFLAVSSINPHKNFETLLRAYARLPKNAPDLRIAGKPINASTYAMLQSIVAAEKLEGRVSFLGEVPYEELPALYSGAIASIMPSRLETFGHPLVESMAAQVPLIASDLPICHEICGGAALYFGIDDIETLTRHLQTVWQDNELRQRMIAAGTQRAKVFSWHESAKELMSVFKEFS